MLLDFPNGVFGQILVDLGNDTRLDIDVKCAAQVGQGLRRRYYHKRRHLFSLATPAPSRPSAAKIATIIAKARQFDAKDVVTDRDSGSNASDDAMLSVLEDHSDDPVRSELMAIIRGLIEDEQLD